MTEKTGRQARRGLRLSRAVPDAKLNSAERVTKWSQEAALSHAARKTHGNSLRAAVTRPSILAQEMARVAAQSREV